MLKPGTVYHIYNRGNNRERLFKTPANYEYFLSRCQKYILPVAQISAWCLLPNHYHFLAKIRTEEEQNEYFCLQQRETETCSAFKMRNPSRGFATAFSTYAMAFNKMNSRTGSLFQDRFKRKQVISVEYRAHLLHYIHYNPSKHKLSNSPETYEWSSLSAYLAGAVDPFLKSSHQDFYQENSRFMEEYRSVDPETLKSSWA